MLADLAAPAIILGIDDIMALIPHRPPMLLLDSVSSLEPGVSITAHRLLRADEVLFQGHFPARPILPGVLVVEAMAQAACVLASYALKERSDDYLPCLINTTDARFRLPLYPGDQLDLSVRVVHTRDNVWKFAGHVHVSGVSAAQAVMMAMVVPRAQLEGARNALLAKAAPC